MVSAGAATDWLEAMKYSRKGLRHATPLQALQPALVFLMVFGACQLLPDSPSVATSKALVYVATFLLLFVMPYFDKPKVHTNVGRLSYMVGSAASPNETAPIRNVRTEELVKAPVLPGLPPNPTLRDLFRSAAAMNKDRPCLGTREVIEAFTDTSGSRPQVKMELGGYQWLTFAQVKDRVDNAGAALAQLGLTKGTNVALYADSSVEWAIASHACFAYGFPVITAYAALGLDALAHSLSEGDVRVLFADATLLPQVAKVMNGRTYEDEGQQVDAAVNGLTTVVYFNNRAVTPDFALQTHIAKLASRDAAHGGPITCISFDELISSGASADVDAEAFAPSADDLAVIMYTSGSTGIPKGVMISHANLVGAIGGLSAGVAGLSANDVYLAYLPCSHVLELAAENCILTAGAALGYGSPLTLTESSRGIAPGRGVKGDAAELKPSVMAAVPAVMDLIRDSILKKVASAGGVKQLLFNFAMRMKTLAYQSGHDSPLWDLLVFDKLRTKVLGGRVRLMLSGGGPLSGATQLFMNVVFCCPVGQGYGLTETCGAGSIVWPDDRTVGRVGPPCKSTDFKLVDWEEGNYTCRDENPRGEIAMSGANVTLGYFKRPEKTAEDFRKGPDGRVWFHTGDIGELCPDGTIKIIDRKKDLVKLSRGEYVSLGKVESTLSSADEISRICVYANSTEAYCVAVVVPDTEVLAAKLGKDVSLESAAADDAVNKAVLDAIQTRGRAVGLQSFEIPRKVIMADDAWTPENEMVTAALKLKRNNIYKVYKPRLEALYSK